MAIGRQEGLRLHGMREASRVQIGGYGHNDNSIEVCPVLAHRIVLALWNSVTA